MSDTRNLGREVEHGSKGKYQNQDVEILRVAKQGDAGFDAKMATGEQVIIKLADGSQKTVARRDVVTNPQT